jgi:hypothetical protein
MSNRTKVDLAPKLQTAAHPRSKMTEKIRLNSDQWNKLLRLANEKGKNAPNEPSVVSHRLRSNGLVGSDLKGCEYLTDQGARRLRQGR